MSDAALSEALKEAYASAPTADVLLHTLELWHPNFTAPIRVVRDQQDFTSTLESTAPRNAGESVTFVGFAFDIVPPEVSDRAIPQCVIEMDNVSREILSNVEQAMTSTELVTAIYRAYLDTDTSGPQNDPPLILTLTSISATLFRIRANAGFPDLANRRFPKLEYTADRFPGLIANA
jgi:hypothetical protein